MANRKKLRTQKEQKNKTRRKAAPEQEHYELNDLDLFKKVSQAVEKVDK